MRQRDVAALDAKYTKELADAKAFEMMLMTMLPLVVVGCTSAKPPSCVKPPLPGVDNAASPDWQTPLNGIISHLSERGQSLCKNNWKEPRSILMSSADRVAHRWATHAIIVSNTHALPAEYKCFKSNKTGAIHLRMFAGFRFNNIFCAATNFGCIGTAFFAQFQKRRNDGWWFPFGATAAGLFWTVNVCWAHPVISRASAVASSIFSWCYSRCFLKFAESYGSGQQT